jgi:Skp1 family, tetramerisation domain
VDATKDLLCAVDTMAETEGRSNASGLVVTLKSLDDFSFELPLEAARLSDLCKNSIPEDLEEVTSIEPIELLRVGQRALEKIVAFLKHHHEEPLIAIPDPLPHATFDEVSWLFSPSWQCDE